MSCRATAHPANTHPTIPQCVIRQPMFSRPCLPGALDFGLWHTNLTPALFGFSAFLCGLARNLSAGGLWGRHKFTFGPWAFLCPARNLPATDVRGGPVSLGQSVDRFRFFRGGGLVPDTNTSWSYQPIPEASLLGRNYPSSLVAGGRGRSYDEVLHFQVFSHIFVK